MNTVDYIILGIIITWFIISVTAISIGIKKGKKGCPKNCNGCPKNCEQKQNKI